MNSFNMSNVDGFKPSPKEYTIKKVYSVKKTEREGIQFTCDVEEIMRNGDSSECTGLVFVCYGDRLSDKLEPLISENPAPCSIAFNGFGLMMKRYGMNSWVTESSADVLRFGDLY